MLDNDSAWSADHCVDALQVPGVLFFLAGVSMDFLNLLKYLIDCIALASFTHSLAQFRANCPLLLEKILF